MSKPIAIEARGVVKAFAAGSRSSTLFRFLRSSAHLGSASQRVALRGVNLQVEEGELVGLVGGNGAGKTTLLKTVAGLYRPSEGELRVQGAPCFLAGLGVGMIGDLSVRENLFLYGSICGVERKRLQQGFDSILAWAELEDYVNSPLRTLSTGMRSRLAFGVTRLVRAPVLLMDEAFAAGDRRFRHKCDSFFEELKQRPGTILVATHDMDFVLQRCTQAIWMHQGQVQAHGTPETVLDGYFKAAGWK